MVSGDTLSPDAGSSNASGTLFVAGASFMAAGSRLRQLILAAARRIGSTDEPVLERGRVVMGANAVSLAALSAEFGPFVAEGFFRPALPEPFIFGMPHAFAYSAQLALIDVDTATGEVEVLRLDNHLDAGRAINPRGVAGQSAGGMAQGLGYALSEDVRMDGGRAQNARFSTYLIPSIRDMPIDMRTVVLQNPESLSPHGGRGVGEISLSPTAAAIANALADAIGVRFVRLPVTPERVHAALAEVLGETDASLQ